MADRPPDPGDHTGVRSSRSKQPATRSSNQQRAGSSGDWRHRLLRYHLPLALASALVLVLFMTLPPFDASTYPAIDMGSSGAFPQQRGERGPMDHGGNQDGPMDRGGDQDEPMDMDHERDQDERMGGHS